MITVDLQYRRVIELSAAFIERHTSAAGSGSVFAEQGFCGGQGCSGEQRGFGVQGCSGEQRGCDVQGSSGEQACPALGGEAAPKPALRSSWRNSLPGVGLLRSPARGKPAHHKKYRSPQKVPFTTKSTAHHKRCHSPQKVPLTTKNLSSQIAPFTSKKSPAPGPEYGNDVITTQAFPTIRTLQSVVVCRALVVSRLVLRWVAKPPQNRPLRSSWRNWLPGVGLLRSPARGKPAHHKKYRSPQKVPFTTKSTAHHKKYCSPQKVPFTTKNLSSQIAPFTTKNRRSQALNMETM